MASEAVVGLLSDRDSVLCRPWGFALTELGNGRVKWKSAGLSVYVRKMSDDTGFTLRCKRRDGEGECVPTLDALFPLPTVHM